MERAEAYRVPAAVRHEVLKSDDGRHWTVAVYTAADGTVYRSAPMPLWPQGEPEAAQVTQVKE